MNGCSIINVFTQNGLTNSGGGGGVSDGKVKVDILATADFLGATGSTGALRVDSTFNYTDGGNFVTLGLADNSVTTAKITDANVTYAKVQNVGAVSLLGNPTGSATSVSEITLGSGLSFNSTTLEVAIGTDVQAWNSKLDTFSALADGSNGQVLQTNGAGAYSWVTISGSGNVSSALDFTTDDRLVLVDFTSGAKNVKQSSVLLSDVSLNSDNLASLTNDATARTNLGVAIGTDVQAWNSKLDTFSALADGSNGQVLQTNGAGAYSWVTISGSGNVSSALDFTTDDRLVLVDFTSGAKNVKQSSVLLSDVSLNSDNLSNLANASTSRTNLGVAIGTDVQAWNSKLDVFSALADGTNGQVLATNGAGVYSWVTISGSGNVSSALDFTTDDRLILVDFTSGAKNVKQSSVLLSDVSLNSDNLSNLANASTSRTNLGVAIGTDVQGYDATLGSIATAGMSLGALFIGTGPNTVAQLSIGSNGQVLTSNGTTALWQTSSASAPTWTTATASTATSASIDLSTNYYVEVDGDADFNLTTIDTTDLQTGIRHLLVFIPSGATRTVTNGLTSMDNFGGAIPVTTSERLVLEIFKDNTGNVNIAGSIVS